MNNEIRQSIYRLASKNIEKKIPPQKSDLSGSINNPSTGNNDLYVKNTDKPGKKPGFARKQITRSIPNNPYENYRLFTPGLEIVGQTDSFSQAVEMSYKGKKVIASFNQGANQPEISNLEYRGFNVGFFFKYSDSALGNIFDSVDNAVKFLSSNEKLKKFIGTVEFDGSLGNAVIFSVGKGSDQVSFFATKDKIIKANDLKEGAQYANLQSKESAPSYGGDFWSRK